MLPAALAAMTEQLAVVGNPSSLHRTGRAARRAVEESREKIAQCLGARPSEVVFTSGGTESDNLAVKGTFWSRHDRDPARVRLLVGATEHHAVLDCVDFLVAHEGAKVTWLECTPEGVVEPATVRDVRVRWASDRRLAARYPFALVQRSQIIGVATEGMTLGGADETMRRVAMLGAQVEGAQDADGLGGEVGAAGEADDAEEV